MAKKFGKIGAPHSPKRKAWLRSIGRRGEAKSKTHKTGKGLKVHKQVHVVVKDGATYSGVLKRR